MMGRRVKKWLALFVMVIAGVAAAVLPSGGGVAVELINAGPEPMRGVVVHVTGASYAIGELAAGARKKIVVYPTSESHIEIEQSTGQRLVVDCYFETAYSGTLTANISSTQVLSIQDEVTF